MLQDSEVCEIYVFDFNKKDFVRTHLENLQPGDIIKKVEDDIVKYQRIESLPGCMVEELKPNKDFRFGAFTELFDKE